MRRAGWREFKCECGRHWKSASRDRFSPSGDDCKCGEWVTPHGHEPDESLLLDNGNLAKLYDDKIISE